MLNKHSQFQKFKCSFYITQSKFNEAEERVAAARGGDIVSRLAAALAALGGVQQGAQRCMPLAAPEPDAVRAQLRACLVSTQRTTQGLSSEYLGLGSGPV